MEQKIYISLSEAEGLVFNKLLIIPKSRFKIGKAQNVWSIAVYVLENTIVDFNSHLLITGNSVLKYEIPDKEENLFLNHFRVPKGLIETKDRLIRESNSNVEAEIKFPGDVNYDQKIEIFKKIRRGVVQCYSLALNNIVSNEFSTEVFKQLNKLSNLDKWKLDFLKSLTLKDTYPIKERNDGKFYAESVLRFNWLGSFLFREFAKNEEIKEDDIVEAKEWFLCFRDKNDITAISRAILNIPNLFDKDFEFIIGYYMAASFYEETDIGINYYKVLISELEKLKLKKNNSLLFWAIFFQSIFKDSLDFLYIIPAFREQLLALEHNLLGLLLPDLGWEFSAIDSKMPSEKQAISEYLQLQNGGKLVEPNFISQTEEKELFKNTFSDNNILNIGLDVTDLAGLKHLFPNNCEFRKPNFSLALTNKPSEITFYVNNNSKAKDWLKDLKLKTKPLSKLIKSNKKALVGFLMSDSYEYSLFKVYEWIIKNAEKPITFNSIVFVLLVNEESEVIQSPEFQNMKLEMENYCKSRFGENVTVLVKNELIKSYGEIKRNLKHLLENYSIRDIELINENVDDRERNWVLSVNNEYVNKSKLDTFYAYLNL